jgi:hypothetical protein
MICSECQDLLSEFIDKSLSEHRQTAVDGHLSGCPRCQTVCDDLSQIILSSSNLPLHAPPSALWARIEHEIADPVSRSWWSRLESRRFSLTVTGRQLAAVAAALVICVGSVVVLSIAAPHSLPSMAAQWDGFQDSQTMAAPVMLSTRTALPSKAAVEEMQRRVEGRQTQWSEELRAAYQRGLAAADARIAECERAGAGSTNEAVGVTETLDAYRVKLLFLEQFDKLHD